MVRKTYRRASSLSRRSLLQTVAVGSGAAAFLAACGGSNNSNRGNKPTATSAVRPSTIASAPAAASSAAASPAAVRPASPTVAARATSPTPAAVAAAQPKRGGMLLLPCVSGTALVHLDPHLT